MKSLLMMAAAGLMLSACSTVVVPDGVLAGDALEKRLTGTRLIVHPVGVKPRKGAATQYIIKMLQSGESTWESNGKFPRETLLHWDVKGNLICFENPNQRFRDAARKQRGQKVRKRGKYDNCSVVAIKGESITIYAPQGAFNKNTALTGKIRPL